MSRPRILLVAATTGYQTRVFADAAIQLGFDLRLATDRCHVLDNPWGDDAIALRFEDPQGAAEKLASERFDGIVGLGDRPAYIAAVIAERLGMRYNTPEATFAAGNKYISRERLRAAGLLVPRYHRVSLDADPVSAARDAAYPCVLKPLGLSASRGVIRADSEADFVAAFERIRAMLESPDLRRQQYDRSLQVESFIPGREFALEGILIDGSLRTLAIFDKPDPLDGPLFEETIYIRPSRESEATQQAIVETTKRAISALGLERGPIHAEMRVNQHGVWMLEVAARPIGGLCARILRFAGSTTLEEFILRHAAGENVSHFQADPDASGVMMIPIPRGGVYGGVSGVEKAEAVSGIEGLTITAKEGQRLIPLPEGSSYLGFLFARAAEIAAVELALRSAHAALEFEIQTTLPVL